MALIKRYLLTKIIENLENKKILIIYGARQVGKTTLDYIGQSSAD
jgi:predicted AAA+ superfamily ATPase